MWQKNKWIDSAINWRTATGEQHCPRLKYKILESLDINKKHYKDNLILNSNVSYST